MNTKITKVKNFCFEFIDYRLNSIKINLKKSCVYITRYH